EGQEHHHRVQPAGGAGVGGVPGVQALGVVGVGAGQRAGGRGERFGHRGGGDHGGRRERRQGGEHRGGAAQSGAYPRSAQSPQSLTTESSQREPTRHGDLRETVHGTPHPDCGGLSYYALFGCTGRVSERRFSRPSDTPGAFTERHNRSRGPRTPPPASRNDLAEKRTMPETEHRLEGSGAELYDRHTFLRLPESFLHERQSSAWRERAVSGTSEGPASAVDLDRPIVTESEIVASTRTDPSPAPAASHPPAPPAPATGPTAPTAPSYRSVFTAAPLAMAVVDREGMVVGVNATLAGLLDSTPEALAGTVAADLVDLSSDAHTWHAYLEVLRGRRPELDCVRRLKHPSAGALWVQVTVTQLPPGEDGDDGVLLAVADISARRELQDRLRHLEMHDPVTRLPNRTLFFERLTAALEEDSYERGGSGRIGLCYLDLDGFKAINDTLGHRIGDRLLTAVAERLTRCAEEAGRARTTTPLVARLGGDEFAVLVEDSTGTEQLAELAESVLAAVQEPFDLGGRRLSVSASIGVVERHAAGTTPTALMQAADTTLSWAKADGKSRWTLFDPERNAHRMTRQALASALRPAIERGEFALEYQPLVGMEDDRVHGVEALVRWNHPQFGTLTPNRFIGLAEEDGSIVPLGRWVLRTACRQARRWQVEHPDDPPIFVSVNVAVR